MSASRSGASSPAWASSRRRASASTASSCSAAAPTSASTATSWPDIGGRESPFGEESPFSVYVPAGRRWSLEARTPVELGVCSAPGGGSFEPRLIGPDAVGRSRRGTGTNVRHVKDILPEGSDAHSLLVVEVITPSGHWSSYPPHKHDRDNLPEESLLEETYYHRLDPPRASPCSGSTTTTARST